MSRPPVSVTIITLNEEKNIVRAVKSVLWADEVLVVDSGSTDRTLELARALGAKVMTNPWPGYGKQKNFAQAQAAHDWILNIDADEEVSPELSQEILAALEGVDSKASERAEATTARGFYFPRKTYYLGKWIEHGGWYPNFLTRMANRKFARWSEPAVHEALLVDGPVKKLSLPLLHYTFSNIQDQILTNLKYSQEGYQELLKKGQRPSLIRLLLKPAGKFIETYFIKKGFMDGLAGFIISINAAHSMFLKYAYLIEADLNHERIDHRQ
ncbi:MAG: glycosyltransferase family 2 protein [Methylotenera sp.]|nr:glycosyltransferase family 2 protein [Oligoflexia bacterium]